MFRLLWNKKLLFLLVPLLVLSQNPKKKLTQLPYDSLKKLYLDNEKIPKKQLEYANAYLIKAKNENNPVQKAKGCFLLSLLSENDKALCYLDSAIVYTKNLNDEKFPAYAYSGKGYIYKKQFKYKEAINNFLIAENIAQKNNPDLYYDVKFSIAALRSEELGEVQEALVLYKQCFNYIKNKAVRTPQYSYSYHLIIFALADAYKTLKQTDSASYYNKLGYMESKLTKNEEYNALFTLNEGANLTLSKSYKAALDSVNKALPKMIAYKNVGNILAAYYYYGESYEGLGKKDLAIKNFIKVDSMYAISKRITPEFTSGYRYLISYYKNKGDKINQLKYITKFMYIDSVLNADYKELTKKLQKEYDTPNLFSEKESLIQSLKEAENTSYRFIPTLVLLVITISLLGWHQYYLKKQYRSRFNTIIKQASTKDDLINQPSDETKEKLLDCTPSTSIGISDELVQQIMKKLAQFESQKGFLQSNLTVQMVSDSFDTNSKYVSKIINTYFEKSFVHYINDLRIDYALVELQKNKKLRNYTLQALAEEFGFNGAESFSAAFYKKTGIKPTYFIKKITELKKT